VLIIAVAVAALLNVFRVNPIQALVWAGVVNGIVATPALIVLILLTTREELMGSFKATPALRAGAWATAVVMFVSNVAMLVTLF